MDGLGGWPLATKSEGVNCLHLVSKTSNLCAPDPLISQSDRRHTNCKAALCTIVHHAIKIINDNVCFSGGQSHE